MEKITELLDNLENLGELIPKLDSLLEWTQFLLSLAVRIGPVCILGLGLIYLLIPPKEANHKAGYRTYFGMGSVEAWRFTQFISGILMTVSGLILTFIAFSTVRGFDGMQITEITEKVINCIKVQIIVALSIYIFMMLFTFVMFDRNGNRRFGEKALKVYVLTDLFAAIPGWLLSLLKKMFKPRKKPQEVPAEAEAPIEEEEEKIPLPQTYEVQGQQVITADDIVIEGLD